MKKGEPNGSPFLPTRYYRWFLTVFQISFAVGRTAALWKRGSRRRLLCASARIQCTTFRWLHANKRHGHPSRVERRGSHWLQEVCTAHAPTRLAVCPNGTSICVRNTLFGLTSGSLRSISEGVANSKKDCTASVRFSLASSTLAP